LAKHKNRTTCGKCGYAVFAGAKKEESKEEEKPKEEKESK